MIILENLEDETLEDIKKDSFEYLIEEIIYNFNGQGVITHLDRNHINNFYSYYEPILDKIENKEDKKKAIKKILLCIIDLKRKYFFRETLKQKKYLDYNDKPNRMLKKRIISAETIINSILTTKNNENKQAVELLDLLTLYIEQTKKIMDNKIKIDDIFYSKTYKTSPKITKQPLKLILKEIISQYDLKITQEEIKQALDNTSLSRY